ncbi:Multimeric flavodoxin WrbA [Tenacibaculum sp. MAR_2009_124]|uniref:flavodoxin family protein n=1 Tax=Tenacibaculum sp. MAR_2009_124 TaxID=1250059 RepID=UPI00089BAD40|nr:NAD(P)H-dependent oxidoreductase [Tenacibaculum sp. MAR_2009_124]SEC89369.1 Multimeric flavodoxin WrbA [Tenacibaculum sp. MAR_2009_124]
MKNTIVIQGSSKSYGNTRKIIDYLNPENNFDIVDLKTKNIGHFDYEFKNTNDDFIPLVKNVIPNYDTIIFATPVYWYSMSGILKVFFDRCSDLLYQEKELGRLLRGKNMAVISNSGANDLKKGFYMPFKESANYLGMNYLGNVHGWFTEDGSEINEEAKQQLETFKTLIN